MRNLTARPPTAQDRLARLDRRRGQDGRVRGGRLHRGFNADSVVHCGANTLFGSQIAFGSLNRQVSKEQLNLLEFPAGALAQTGARTTQIVRRKLGDARSAGCLLDNMPDSFCRDPGPNDPASTTHAAKDPPFVDAGDSQPLANH